MHRMPANGAPVIVIGVSKMSESAFLILSLFAIRRITMKAALDEPMFTDDVVSLRSANDDDGDGIHWIPQSMSSLSSLDSIDGGSVDIGGDGIGGKDNLDGGGDFVTKENQLVRYSKALVLCVLAAAACGSSMAAYAFSRRSEDREFRSRILSYAEEIISVSRITSRNVFDSFKSLSVTTTSMVLESDAEWPFVTMPHFRQRTEQVLKISGADYIALVPFVDGSNRTAWEEYSVAHQGWIQDIYPEQNTKITPFVYGTDSVLLRKPDDKIQPRSVFLPIWQVSPFRLASNINLNIRGLDLAQSMYSDMIRTRSNIMSRLTSLMAELGLPSQTLTSSVAIPIFRDMDAKEDIVGVFIATISFQNFFRNVLPDDNDGMVVVVNDGCGSAVTYSIDGPDVTILSLSDLVDPAIPDDYSITVPFLLTESDNGVFQEYNCFFTLRLYPSKSTFDARFSYAPLVSALGVFGVFMITTAVFVLYDLFVEKRQVKVMVSAQQSDAIVSSLFPSQVRDRLRTMVEQLTPQRDEKTRPRKRKEVMKVDESADCSGRDDQLPVHSKDDSKMPPEQHPQPLPGRLYSSKPIADLYTSVTVLFADIVGFTSWSSKREPTDVFQLLETVYGSLDEIAGKMGIFKVETIGDCYVAACGLPKPRPDHGLAMVKFAHRGLSKVTEVFSSLAAYLGPETSSLAMRFGLHSGPVTAGVLRGTKSRFQLFGDTMNTAARMESNGAPNRIHMSEDTARLLKKVGKGKWLEKRSEKISAKGKGTMQTYWLFLRPHSKGNGRKDGGSNDTPDQNETAVAAKNDDDDYDGLREEEFELAFDDDQSTIEA